MRQVKTSDILYRTLSFLIIHNDRMKTVLITASLVVLAGATGGNASSFLPSNSEITQIANRFRAILDTIGMTGVGIDVLRCYDDSLEDRDRLKVCIMYDTAARIIDHRMLKLFIARGIKGAAPTQLYTDDVFNTRMNTYGRVAFSGSVQGMTLVGRAAQKVVEKVMPR